MVRYESGEMSYRVDGMISKLSIAIECCVSHPVNGIPIAICKHGVIFPDYIIKTGNWAAMRRRHDDEMMLADD